MACHISFRSVTYVPAVDSVTITVITDLQCHIWCRLSLEPPRIHNKSVIRRGEPFMSELRFCFTQYEDNEQSEAGDTYTHTWIKPNWPYCTTKYFYLYGYVAGTACPSTSPPFKYHNNYSAPPEQEVTLFTGGGTDAFAYFLYGSNWVWRCPHGYAYVGNRDINYKQGGGGFRFLNVPLEPTSNVLEAHLLFRPYAQGSFVVCNSRIRVENNINPATFSTLANYQSRTNYGGNWFWDGIEQWFVGNWYPSRDIAWYLNYIIAKPGWISGNPMAFTWDDWANRSDVAATRWCHGGTADPLTIGTRLYIKYIP